MSAILICDDERDIVSAVKIYLAGEGYDIFMNTCRLCCFCDSFHVIIFYTEGDIMSQGVRE